MCYAALIPVGLALFQGFLGNEASNEQGKTNALTLEANAKSYDTKADMSLEEAKFRRIEANIADAQKAVAEGQADKTLAQGWKDVAALEVEGEAAIGGIRAELGASGFEVNTGTNIDIQTDTGAAIAVDAQTMKYNSQVEAFGFEQQAFAFGASAFSSRFAAGQATKQAASDRAAAESSRKAARISRKRQKFLGIF
ncbi:hypothetical protein KAR91_23840 [Candidatus Pacearchaeota archaeon]|nr:hypothetical protein [Candidatus Pacearchaeota archaeon]